MAFFFFQAEDGIRDIGVTGVQTCALPISPTWTSASSTALSEIAPILEKIPTIGSTSGGSLRRAAQSSRTTVVLLWPHVPQTTSPGRTKETSGDRKSTRLNSSHANISYAVFCLKK